jgi:hypothetical protein
MRATPEQIETARNLWNPAVNAVLAELESLRAGAEFEIQIGGATIRGFDALVNILKENAELKAKVCGGYREVKV